MSKYIRTTERDGIREQAFLDAYGYKVRIKSITYNDENWDWDKVELFFTDINNNDYLIQEYYKPGKDNSTAYVTLKYVDGGRDLKFDYRNFLAAELALVDIIHSRLHGD